MTRNLVRVGHFGWPAPLLVAVGMRLTQHSVSLLVWLPVLAVAVLPWAAHLVGICPRCARRMPTLPQRAAERHARALAWPHRPWRRPVTWVVTVAHLGLTWVAGGRYAAWSALTLAIAFGAAMWALDWHARLQPWCPQCPGGGLDDTVRHPAPSGLGVVIDDPPEEDPVGGRRQPAAGRAADPVAGRHHGAGAPDARAGPGRADPRPGRPGRPGAVDRAGPGDRRGGGGQLAAPGMDGRCGRGPRGGRRRDTGGGPGPGQGPHADPAAGSGPGHGGPGDPLVAGRHRRAGRGPRRPARSCPGRGTVRPGGRRGRDRGRAGQRCHRRRHRRRPGRAGRPAAADRAGLRPADRGRPTGGDPVKRAAMNTRRPDRVEVSKSWLLVGAVVVAGVTAGGVMAADGAQGAAPQQAQLPPVGDPSATASPAAPDSVSVQQAAAEEATRSAAVPNITTETAGPVASSSCGIPDVRYADYRERFVAAGNPVRCLDPMPWEGSLSPDGLDALRDFARRHRYDPVYGRDPVPGANELIRQRYGPGADQVFEILGRPDAADSSAGTSASGEGNFLERLRRHLSATQPAVRTAGS